VSILDEIRAQVKVDGVTGCWMWQGNISPAGYGQMHFRGVCTGVHRVVYEMKSGTPPPRGMVVCHSCDVKACCNPDHLWLGSYSDNSNDASEKGRLVVGEKHHNAKLSASQVQDARDRHASGESIRAISRGLGVSKKTVALTVSGETWAHVAGEPVTLAGIPRGEAIKQSKLTESLVREIRARNKDGESQRSIARSLGVNHWTIACACSRKTWAHVD